MALAHNWWGVKNNTSQVTMVLYREWIFMVWLMPVFVFPFYWGELMRSSVPVIGLKASIIPLILALFIVEGFSLGIFINKGLYGNNPTAIQAQICTIVITTGLFAIYFTIQAVRVIFALAKMQDGFARTPVQRRTTFLALCLAVLVFAFTANYAASFASGIGIVFPNVMMYTWFFYVFAALDMKV